MKIIDIFNSVKENNWGMIDDQKSYWESFKTNWNQLKNVNIPINTITNKYTSSIYASIIIPRNDNLNHINNLIKLNFPFFFYFLLQ